MTAIRSDRGDADKTGAETSGPEKYAPPDRRQPEKLGEIDQAAALDITDVGILRVLGEQRRRRGNTACNRGGAAGKQGLGRCRGRRGGHDDGLVVGWSVE